MKALWGSVLWLAATVHLAMAKSLGQMTQDAERDLKLMTGFLEIVFTSWVCWSWCSAFSG